MWVMGILGAVSILSFFNMWIRTADMYSIKNFFISLPVLIIVHYLYWIGYSKAPAFIWAWLTSVVVGAFLALGIEYFHFQQVNINIYTISGILLVILGLGIIKMN